VSFVSFQGVLFQTGVLSQSYEKDKRTCVLKVKLEAGKTYAIWVNSDRFTNFKDADGRPAVPYLLVFQTRKAD
jgi:hypothetical protein